MHRPKKVRSATASKESRLHTRCAAPLFGRASATATAAQFQRIKMEDQPSTFKTEVLRERGEKRPPSTRAIRRARTMALVKEVEDLIAGLGPHQRKAIKTLVGQLKAMKPITHNGVIVDWIPDEVIRQKAAIAILEWLHGKPREFQMQMRGDSEDLQSLLQAMRNSPASQASLQKTVEGREIPPAFS
jgi:hypothetical protein